MSIIHLTFGQEYTAAIEAKQVAQQDAERARFVVERALQEKKSTIIRAQGVSKSAELVGEAIKNNPAFVQLRRIDSAKEIATVISRSANKVYLNSDSLLLNLMADSSSKYVFVGVMCCVMPCSSEHSENSAKSETHVLCIMLQPWRVQEVSERTANATTHSLNERAGRTESERGIRAIQERELVSSFQPGGRCIANAKQTVAS